MNTTSRNLLILLLLIVWGLYTILVYRGCYDTLCTSCGDSASTLVPSDTTNPYDLAFKWSSPQAYVNPGFTQIRDDLKAKASETNIVEIVGLYFAEEAESEEAGAALGLARAEEIRKKYFADLPDYMVRLSAKLAEDVPSNAKTGFFEASEFGFISPENDKSLGFLWSNPKPFATNAFDAVKDSIQAGMTDNNILEIIGLYYEGETTPEGIENIGLERAKLIRKQFFPDIPEDRIRLRARANPDVESAKRNYFESAIFEWISPKETGTSTVEELDDRIIIRFAYNSTVKEIDPKVDEYLIKLAKRVNQTGESITIVGHADSSGPSDYNEELGMRRATQIKNILIKDGVSADVIAISSMGERQPVASNDTEQGQRENRRAEVRLIKKED